MKHSFPVFFLAMLLMFFSGSLYADLRTADEAVQIAADCLNRRYASQSLQQTQKRMPRHTLPADMQVVMTIYKQPIANNTGSPSRVTAQNRSAMPLQTESSEPALYVVSNPQGGFAVISADDRTPDLLCINTDDMLTEQHINPAFRWWLQRLSEQISALPADYARAPQEAQVTAISPLLGNIAWGQGDPYNDSCPLDYADYTWCYTGCVATAAAQIMRYWKYPQKGTGSHSYVWYNYDPDSYNSTTGQYTKYLQTKTLTANFSNTTYDWDNMLDTYTGSYTTNQKSAIATLMYHCGIACDMQYGGDKMNGSGALIDQMAIGMVSYFGYTANEYLCEGDGDTFTQIRTAINTELEAKRPVLMGGNDNSELKAGGHAFVCDGRDIYGYFHINWGWNGNGNCYTLLSVLQPLNYTETFSSNIRIITGLKPNKTCTTTYSTEEITIPSWQIPYKWNGLECNEEKNYQIVLTNAEGCDSIATLRLSFAPTDGKCGDNMYWSFDRMTGVLSIYGYGKMYDYEYSDELPSTAPWYCFHDDITSIKFSNVLAGNITYIGANAFWGLNMITSLNIPNEVTEIGEYALGNCVKLETVTLPDNLETISEGMLSYNVSLKAFYSPSGTKIISDYAFYRCISLTSVTISNTITTIGDRAFEDCTSLTEVYAASFEKWCSIDFSKSDSYYGSCTPVWNAKKLVIGFKILTDVIIPDELGYVKRWTFANNEAITSLTLHKDITSVELAAFYGCTNIASITSYAVTPPIVNEYAFTNVPRNIPLYVPQKSISLYQNADVWKEFLIQKLPPLTVTFQGYDFSKTVTVDYGEDATPPAVPSVKGYTFAGWDHDIKNITTDNLVINAKYDINTYDVTFLDWDGTIISEQTVPYLQSAQLPSDPQRSGYVFSGWGGSFDEITDRTFVVAQYEKESENGNITISLVDHISNTVLSMKQIYIDIPEPQEYSGYTFVGWYVMPDKIENGITIEARYNKDSATSNKPTEDDKQPKKIIRNGTLYIQLPTGETYSGDGRKVK